LNKTVKPTKKWQKLIEKKTFLVIALLKTL